MLFLQHVIWHDVVTIHPPSLSLSLSPRLLLQAVKSCCELRHQQWILLLPIEKRTFQIQGIIRIYTHQILRHISIALFQTIMNNHSCHVYLSSHSARNSVERLASAVNKKLMNATCSNFTKCPWILNCNFLFCNNKRLIVANILEKSISSNYIFQSTPQLFPQKKGVCTQKYK